MRGAGVPSIQGKHKPPCYGCKEREVGCHAICPKYKEYDDERKKISQESHEEILRQRFFDELLLIPRGGRRRHK